MLGGASTKKLNSRKMLDRTGIEKVSLTQYVRWGWQKNPLFTDNARRGWYKNSSFKLILLNILSGAGKEKLNSLKTVEGADIKGLL